MSRAVIVLCEDRQQEVFIRPWLLSRGIRARDITVREIPAGRGSGEVHVRDRYPSEIKALRQVNSYSEVGRVLVTVIDADTFSVQQRHNILDRSLTQAGLERRSAEEKIAVLVPKRNIETWIHHLRGEIVNETDIYRRLDKPSECKADVARFVAEPSNSPLKENAPPSLQLALAEMERII
jgi:hypothetical protein